jgi:hypothetical protein
MVNFPADLMEAAAARGYSEIRVQLLNLRHPPGNLTLTLNPVVFRHEHRT